MHDILGTIAVVLFMIGAGAYLRGMIKSQVRPHFFTWLIWTITVTIIFAAQITEGAGAGAWATGFSILFTAVVAVYAFFRGEKNFTRGDWISLIIALACIPIWIITQQPAYAAVILTGIDCLAYYPTFRKSYLHPEQENLTCYTFDGARHLVSFFALEQITLATASYPIALTVISFAFVAFACWRRRAMRAKLAA